MTTRTTSLADWLLERIAEDEAAAAYADSRDGVLSDHDTQGWWLGHYQHYTRHDPARVLAECQAKRAIVKLHPLYRCTHTRCGGDGWHCRTCGPDVTAPCPTLLALAQPYDDDLENGQRPATQIG